MIAALIIGSAIASDSQNLVPALIMLPAIGILLALHPAQEKFLRRGAAPSRTLLAITVIGAVPLVAYALATARRLRKRSVLQRPRNESSAHNGSS